jgi:ankyrin repeat protein
LLQILLSHGVEMDPTAMFYAIGLRFQRNGTATLKVLIDHGADISHVSKRWATPLHQAVRTNQKDKVTMLLECGADSNIKSSHHGGSTLEYAQNQGLMDLAEYDGCSTCPSGGLRLCHAISSYVNCLMGHILAL